MNRPLMENREAAQIEELMNLIRDAMAPFPAQPLLRVPDGLYEAHWETVTRLLSALELLKAYKDSSRALSEPLEMTTPSATLESEDPSHSDVEPTLEVKGPPVGPM